MLAKICNIHTHILDLSVWPNCFLQRQHTVQRRAHVSFYMRCFQPCLIVINNGRLYRMQSMDNDRYFVHLIDDNKDIVRYSRKRQNNGISRTTNDRKDIQVSTIYWRISVSTPNTRNVRVSVEKSLLRSTRRSTFRICSNNHEDGIDCFRCFGLHASVYRLMV